MAKQKPDPTPKSEDEILEVCTIIMNDRQFVERNAEYQRRHDFLYGLTPVQIPGLPALATEYRHPRLRKDCNAFKNLLLAPVPIVDVAAQADGPKAIKAAQNMKNYAARLLRKWRAQGVFDGVAFDAVSMGRGHLNLRLNAEVMPLWATGEDYSDPGAFIRINADVLKEFSEGDRSDLFVPEHVIPSTVYWSADKGYKLMRARVPLRPLASKYAERGSEKEALITSLAEAIAVDTGVQGQRQYEATVYVISDCDFIYHIIWEHSGYDASTHVSSVGDKGMLLGVYDNVFGCPTIFDWEAERTGDPHALYSALPLIDGMYQTSPMLSTFGTIILHGGVQQAQQQQTLADLPGPEAAADRENVPAGGEVQMLNNQFVLSPGRKIEQSGIKLGEDTIAAFTMMLGQESDYGLPAFLRNPAEFKATSGYERARAEDAVQNLLSPPLEHLGDLDGALISACFNAISELDVPVGIDDLTASERTGTKQQVVNRIVLQPDDVVDHDLSVTFSSETSASKIMRQEEGLKLFAQGLVSFDEFLRDYRDIQDVERWYMEALISGSRRALMADSQKMVDEFIQKIREVALQRGVQAANLPAALNELAQQAMQPAPPAVDPNAMQMQGDPSAMAGPSMPTGPGSAMPLMPPAPMGAEGGQLA